MSVSINLNPGLMSLSWCCEAFSKKSSIAFRREHKSRDESRNVSTLLTVRMNERVWKDSEERFLLLVFRERRLWSTTLVIHMSARPFTRERMLIFSSKLAERCK